jgi:N-acetylmuramoyl-L-alanine amidase CwlD
MDIRERKAAIIRKRKRRRRRNKRLIMLFSLIIVITAIMMSAFASENGLTSYKKTNDSLSSSVMSEDIAYSIESMSDSRPLIVIDPGHGGETNPGCEYDGYMEKDLNLHLAFLVRNYLEHHGYQVVLTRDNDNELSLDDRNKIAERVNADAFISIHHNALKKDNLTNGVETWIIEGASSKNAVLADYIQNEVCATTKAKNRGLRQSEELIILKDLTMPSCLIEVGFLSSDTERALLITPAYQEKIAQGITNGILSYFAGL